MAMKDRTVIERMRRYRSKRAIFRVLDRAQARGVDVHKVVLHWLRENDPKLARNSDLRYGVTGTK